MKTTGKVLLWFASALGLLALGVGLLAYFALQTQPGHNFLLRTALGQTDRFMDGEVRVGSIRSDGLLRGFTLTDVAIVDDRGRSFIEADSLRLGYSVRALLRRDIGVAPVEVWRPRVVLETLHGDETSNLVRIFRLAADTEEMPTDDRIAEPDPSESQVVAPASRVRLTFDGMRVHDGSFLLRTPVEGDPSPRAVVTSVSGFEGLHQELHFHEIEAQLGRARILDPDRAGEVVEFRSLSLTGAIFEDPFRVEDFRGEIQRIGSYLTVAATRLELTDTRATGGLVLGWGDEEAGMTLEMHLRAEALSFTDFRWLEPRLPEGGGSLTLAVEGPLSEGRWRVTAADLRTGDSRIRGRLGLDLGPTIRFTQTDLIADPVELALLDPWLEEPIPFGGRVSGPLRLSGTFDALEVDGRLEYGDPETDLPPSTVEARGTLLLGGGEPGVRGLSARIDPLDFRTLQAFLPEFPVTGSGALGLEASGRISEGIQVSADLRHRSVEGLDSRILAVGTVQYQDEELRLSLDGGMDPVELAGVASALDRELPFEGAISGPYRVNGRLSELELWTRVATAGGTLTLTAAGDALDPGRGYRLTATTPELDLAAFVPELPEPSVVRGEVEVAGRGLDLESLEGTARVTLEESRSGHLLVDLVDVELEAIDGRLRIERFLLESPIGQARGTGELGLREDAGRGEMAFSWEVPELSALRPLVMGDTIIQPDTLSALELETLRWDGVDPDTLAGANGHLLEGRAFGELNLTGAVRDLELHGFVELSDLLWGEGEVEWGRLDGVATLHDFRLAEAGGTLQLSALAWQEWAFARAAAGGRWTHGSGDVEVELFREAGEVYRADAAIVQDSVGTEVTLRTLSFEMDPVEWSLVRPSVVRIDDGRVAISDFEIRRPDEASLGAGEEETRVRIWVDGVLDLDGPSDLRVETERLDLTRLGHLARIESPPSGFVDLTLSLRGPADAPEMDGEFLLRELEVGGAEVDRVAGTLDYRDRALHARLDVDHEGQRLLTADGSYPIDLAFRDVEERFPNRDVDVTLELDALPAATLLSFLEGIEDIQGTIDGRIRLRGAPRDLQPSGSLRLAGGALSLPEIGLHPREIEADFELTSDGLVTVSGQARSRGLARVSGTVDLNDLADPGFDLRITTSGFQATERRDLEARIGGEITLTGRFQAPRVGGNVQVEQGVLFLEEFARTAEIVDLTDPAFFDVVDTTLVADRPAVEAAQNPFLNNLIVNVDLTLQRDFWLRSREMNVEIGGDLIVTFDRPKREILLVGTLEATRGNYVAFGRQFQVQEGVVEFVGTPGINPTLDIRAVHRLRREGQEPLNIIAAVEGPLLALRISLESESQPPIAESDLISYLVFGRPSFALGSGEASVLQGAAGAGVSVGIGTLAGQLSAVLAQQIGLDYFSITQTQDGMGGPAGGFSDTQIEVGQYLAQDLFLAMVLRPLGGMGGGQTQIPGARLEWRFTDTWTLEAFVEDRFGREGVYTFGDAGLQLTRILGLEIYREWGY